MSEPAVLNSFGLKYMAGTDMPKDVGKAVMCFQQAADMGYAEAQVNLAVCYLNGTGVPENPKEAVGWLLKAVAQESQLSKESYCKAAYILGTYYGMPKGGGDIHQSVKWLQESIKYKNALRKDLYGKAAYILGDCFMRGRGVARDAVKAFNMYYAAHRCGHPAANNEYGLCYLRGTGVKKDQGIAFSCFKQAAEQCYAPAQCNLGLCYSRGWGVKRDWVTAVQWFRKSAENGYAPGQYRLAYSYLRGLGIKRDWDAGEYWMEKAEAQGYRPAISALKFPLLLLMPIRMKIVALLLMAACFAMEHFTDGLPVWSLYVSCLAVLMCWICSLLKIVGKGKVPPGLVLSAVGLVAAAIYMWSLVWRGAETILHDFIN